MATKIREGKHAQVTEDFMILPRILPLQSNCESEVDDRVARVATYIAAGADGVIIDLLTGSEAEFERFMQRFKDSGGSVPVFVAADDTVKVKEKWLQRIGVGAVIYTNQLLNAAHKAMAQAGMEILRSEGVQDDAVTSTSDADSASSVAIGVTKR